MWFGSVCPWASFIHNDVIPISRLVPLGILILLLRRLPVIFALRWSIWQIDGIQATLFTGFFGPIGVSAVFYLYLGLEFLNHVTVDGEVREDAKELEDQFVVIVWFLAICSIVVHGLSVPVGKLGWYLPRTFSSARISRAMSTEQDPAFHVHDDVSAPTPSSRIPAPQSVPFAFPIGGTLIRSDNISTELTAIGTGQGSPYARAKIHSTE